MTQTQFSKFLIFLLGTLIVSSLAMGESPSCSDAGDRQLRQGSFTSALKTFSACVEANPKDAIALTRRGNAYTQIGEYAKAIADLDLAVALDPKKSEAFFARGYAYSRTGELSRGLDDLRIALRINNALAAPLNNIAWKLATSVAEPNRDGELAVAFAKLVCEQTEYKNWQELDTLAAAYAEHSQFDDAIKTAELAIKLGVEAHGTRVDEIRERLADFRQKKPFRRSYTKEVLKSIWE